MQLARPAFALHPRQFGKGRVREEATAPERVASQLSEDIRLFATTFAAGFLFVSILIA